MICSHVRAAVPYPTMFSKLPNRRAQVDMTPQNPIERETDVLRLVERELRDRLPEGWRTDVRLFPKTGGWRPDALLEISAPTGDAGFAVIEAKLGLEPREVDDLVAKLERAIVDADLPGEGKGIPMVVARFISPRARDLLEKAGVSYADSTGNVRLALAWPALFIATSGDDRNPWREVRDLRSLKGRSAARVIRALCDLRPPFGVRDLAKRAGSSAGSTVRVLDFLEREALIRRDESKRIIDVALGDLIRRWSNDFRFSDQNSVARYFEPRRLGDLVERLPSAGSEFAITGSFAAKEVAEYADARLLVVYAPDRQRLAEVLGLRSTDSQSNVWIAEPRDDLPFERAWEREGLRFAALSQVACDLFDLPGRSPAEAEELVRWMETAEDAWRAD
jgi:hypothetical protein